MEIEMILVQFGADAIIKEYAGDGTIRQLSFKFQGHGYQLPANVDKVKERLVELKETHRIKMKTSMADMDAQAVRVAWRVLKDWLHSQMTVIYIGQAEVDQVLLPYMSDGRRTVYEMFKDGTLAIEDMR